MKMLISILVVGVIYLVTGIKVETSQVSDKISKGLYGGITSVHCEELCESVLCEKYSTCTSREEEECSGYHHSSANNRYACSAEGASSTDWCQRDNLDDCSNPFKCIWTGVTCNPMSSSIDELKGYTECQDTSGKHT